MAEDDYNIGYRKPPLWNRFRPGQSGNPNGRPKKSKIALTILEQITKELEGLITIRENGRVIKVTKMQAAIKNLVANAMRGDPKSIALMMKTEPPPINESGTRVNLGILWTRLRRNRNGSEEIYDRADYRVFTTGRGDDRAWMHD